MIAGKVYILSTNRTTSGGVKYALRPASNAENARLEIWTRPVADSLLSPFLFRLEAYNTEFVFRHVATGLYLTVKEGGAADVILKPLQSPPTTFQRFNIQGIDAGARIISVADSTRQFTVISDTESERVSMQEYSGNPNSPNENVTFSEYNATPTGLASPIVSQVFKNYQSILVEGIVEGATVRLYRNNQVAQTVSNVTGGSTNMLLPSNLAVGDFLQFEQTLNNVNSAKTAAMFVQEAAGVYQRTSGTTVTYRAHKLIPSSSGATPDSIVATKGEPIAVSRTSRTQAQQDIETAGFTEITYTV